MTRNRLPLFLLASLATLHTAHAADPAPKGKVLLTVKADLDQPTGWPAIVEVTVQNMGDVPISWWSSSHDGYPGGENFDVRIRYDGEEEWKPVAATPESVGISGGPVELQPGKSIVTPLAVPVRHADGVNIRIGTKSWDSGAVEAYVRFSAERRYLDLRQAQVIAAVTGQTAPFFQYLAGEYGDATVVDALLKLATVDNRVIAASAARSLVFQKSLPAEAGDALAARVAAWFGPAYERADGTLCSDLATAALKTRSRTARDAILHLLALPGDPPDRPMILMETVMISPGDETWLRQAKAAIDALPASTDELAKEKKRVSNWLAARIAHPQYRLAAPSSQVSPVLQRAAAARKG